jgi:hypothetical protein
MLLRLIPKPRQPISAAEFVSHYSGVKKARYEAAVASLASRPYNKTDAKLGTFVKAEFINLDAKPDPAPRSGEG